MAPAVPICIQLLNAYSPPAGNSPYCACVECSGGGSRRPGTAHVLGAPIRTRGNTSPPREPASGQTAERRARGFHPLGADGAAGRHLAPDVQQRRLDPRDHVLHRPHQRPGSCHPHEHGLPDGDQVPNGNGGRDVRDRHIHHRVHLSLQRRPGPELCAGRRGVWGMAGRRRDSGCQLQPER